MRRRRPLPFDFEGKGVVDSVLVVENGGLIADSGAVSSHLFKKFSFLDSSFTEPTSVLDSARISCIPSSSSTLSSSFGGRGAASTDTAGVPAVSDTNPYPKWHQDSTTATSSNVLPFPTSHEFGTVCGRGGGNLEECAIDDWESVLSESVPSQDQSVLRWIMGDAGDPITGSLNKVLQIDGGSTMVDFELGEGLGPMDQDFGGGDQFGANFMSTVLTLPNRSGDEKFGLSSNLPSNYKFPSNSQKLIYPSVSSNLGAISLHPQTAFDSSAIVNPTIFNPQMLINQQQPHNPSFCIPLTYSQHQDKNSFMPQLVKRHNSCFNGRGIEPGVKILKGSYADRGPQEMISGKQELQYQQAVPNHPQPLPHYPQYGLMWPGPKPNVGGADELGNFHQKHQQEQAIIDHLYKSAELVQTGNPLLAQGILARLNHQLSPIDKPFYRAAFYFMEALQLLLHTTNNLNPPSITSLPFNLLFSIGAYKAFSEISPIVQFASFTCNQAFLEALDGCDRIHIVDFDIGYGGQWASLIQELALRCDSLTYLKITALNSFSDHDQIDIGLTRENLIQFANEVNITLEFEVMNINSLNSGSWPQSLHVSENEVIAVNLPVASLANHQLSVPLVLHFVKQLSPRIIVSVDRGCYRTDLSFANRIIHALQSYSVLLESLDAVNVNADIAQKIERFLLQPGIEKIVMGQYRSPEKTQHWRTAFLSSGFSPVTFSNFAESQAECVVKRIPVQGFQVEKRQSSLVLCWQLKELISASAWRC